MPTHALRRASAAAVAVALALAGVVVTAAPAHALDFPVVNGASAGAGSLADAITQANATPVADSITFDMTTVPAVIDLTADLPAITAPLTITGPGSGELTILGIDRAFSVLAGGTGTTITGLTIDADGAGADGLVVVGGDVTVDDLIADGLPDFAVTIEDASFSATDSSFSDNGSGGVFVDHGVPDETVTLETVDLNNNAIGFSFTGNASTGAITFTDVEAYLNSNRGISITSLDSEVFITSSLLHENGLGAYVNLTTAGRVAIVNTDAHHNDIRGYELILNGAEAFFNGSDTFENGIDASVDQGGGARVELDDAELISYGSTFSDNTGTSGGGIYIENMSGESALILEDSEIARNVATTGTGGGIHLGSTGGVNTASTTLRILGTSISGNTAPGSGGGMYVDSIGNGVPHQIEFLIERSTFDGNETTNGEGGGLRVSEFVHDLDGDPIITIDSSTFSRNRAPSDGGAAIFLNKGLDSTAFAVTRIVNSTVSGNTGALGSIVVAGGSSSEEIGLIILNSTIAANPAGGLIVDDQETEVLIGNSILANNGGVDLQHDADPALLEVFYSNVRVPAAGNVDEVQAGTGNQVATDPLLGALADNGGPTLTMLPQPGSPVFDAGDPAFAPPPAVDQRGEPRVITRLDMGAVESPRTLPATGATPSPWGVGAALLLVLAGAGVVALRRRVTA